MSTNRYLNAGLPGTGPTLENMDSRIKAWSIISGAGTTNWGSFNVSSFVDNGLGRNGVYYTMTINLPTPVCSTDAAENGTYSNTATYFNTYCNSSAGTAADPGVYTSNVGGRF